MDGMATTAPTIVVVGAGLAGLRASERLRAAGHTGRLVVIGDEEHPPYNRPPLSKEVLRGTMGRDRLPFRQRPATAESVEWRLGTRVTAVDLDHHLVRLESGEELTWDGLVVATGVRGRRLDLAEPRSRHVVRTIEDAERLAPTLTRGARVVVLGGGFIGCEVAATAATLGCSVTVVEPLPAPLHGPLGGLLAREVQRRHEAHGVRFALGRRVATIERTGAHVEVLLDEGERLPADVVVEAIGSQANVEPLAGTGLDLEDGVLCDGDLHPLRDGEPVLDVVVAGDVARFPLTGYGPTPVRVEHWAMPTDMAAHAAASLLAGIGGGRPDPERPFVPMPSFWSEQYGVRLQSFGLPRLGLDDVRVLEGDLTDEAAVGYHGADGTLVGVVLLGLATRMRQHRSAVETAQLSRALEPTGR